MLLHKPHIEEEIIDYNEIIKLPYLEIREGLHIFTGLKVFDSYFQTITEEAKKYFLREKIWWVDLSRENTTLSEQQKLFNKFYPDFLEKTKYLLKYGLESPCEHIKIVHPIYNVIPPPEEVDDRILYLWKTDDLLYFALELGIILPIDLQTALGINQIEDIESYNLKDNERLHLSIFALAQLLWFLFPNLTYIEMQKEMVKILHNEFSEILSSDLFFFVAKNEKKYFKNENFLELDKIYNKTTVLDNIFKEANPRIEKGKGRQKLSKPLLIKISPKIMHNGQTNFSKLKIIISTIGCYLCNLKIVTDLESAIQHPIFLEYMSGQSNRTKHFIKYCLSEIFLKETLFPHVYWRRIFHGWAMKQKYIDKIEI